MLCHVWLQELEGAEAADVEQPAAARSCRWLGATCHGWWRAQELPLGDGCRRVRLLVLPAAQGAAAAAQGTVACELVRAS